MSTKLCEVRPETGKGPAYSKYCVKDDKVAKAEACWTEYRHKVLGGLTEEFEGFIQQMHALHENAMLANATFAM